MNFLNLFKLSLSFILLSLIFPGICLSQGTNFSYIHPVPGSINLNPGQNIILKYSEGFNPESIGPDHLEVRGSESGLIPVHVLLSPDHRTAIFKPVRDYKLGEVINIHVKEGIISSSGKSLHSVDFSFRVINYDRNEIYSRLQEMQTDDEAISVKERQGMKEPLIIENNLPLDYPAPTVNSYGDHDNEYLFLNLFSRNMLSQWENYITIIDSYGTPVFYERSEENRINFNILPNGYLTYSSNYLQNTFEEKYYIIDSAYNLIDSVNTGNGYILDAHDMLLLENGHYLVMSYDPQPVDMSQIVPGGDPWAIVTGLVIQEVDNNQNVYFQWRSWDYFEITDATYDIDLTSPVIDYVHANAFEIDFDGNILLSSRHLDEITKINYNTGNIIWRFGLNSENNMFVVHEDLFGFSHQHDIRRLPNGHYSIYDNGNLHNPQFTQALEYIINENSLEATLVWDYQHSPQVFAGSMGSFRTQADGSRIIGWGGNNFLSVTELNADNSVLREVSLPALVTSYRAVKSNWETNVFSTQDELSHGNYAGYTGWKENLLYIFNESENIIKITSVHHHLDEFMIDAAMPIPIFPHSYATISVGFQPQSAGEYHDRLTLNYDNEENTKRISRQLQLQGIFDDGVPSVFFDPSHGSTNISPDTELVISFDEPVKKVLGGDIQDEDIPSLIDLRETFFNGDEVTFSGTINEDKTVITIFPEQSLNDYQQYYVKLKRGLIANFQGDIINLDEECYFMTGMLVGNKELLYEDVRIYPNPFTDIIRIDNLKEESHLISIYNISGDLLFKTESNESSLALKMEAMSAGIYLVHIYNKESGESKVFKTFKNTTSH